MINDYLHSNDNYDYILWIDADAIFINFNTKIEQFISRSLGRDILIAEDMNPCCLINAGVILIKNTKWSQELFKQVWELDRYDHVKFYEQSALVKVLRLQGQQLERYKHFHTYVNGGEKGDKVFDNIVVIPHIDFNTNSGWLHKSRTGLTKLRRRRVKRNLRIKNSSNDSHTINSTDTDNNNDDDNNDNNSNTINNIDTDNNNDDNNNTNNNNNVDNNNTNNSNDNTITSTNNGIDNEDDDECATFIFHAAGLKDKNDALLYMVKKFDIAIDMEPLTERFKLKRDKLGRPPRYSNNNNNNNNTTTTNNNNNNNTNNSNNDDSIDSIDDSQHNDNNGSNDDHISL